MLPLSASPANDVYIFGIYHNQVAVHANSYGIYPTEIAALQKDYADLWKPLAEFLKKLAAVVEM